MKLSPNTRMGTVEGNKWERGHVQYLFRSDPRFSHGLPDVYVMEDELEHSQRPSDAEIVKINDLIWAGVLSLPELRTLCLVPNDRFVAKLQTNPICHNGEFYLSCLNIKKASEESP
jgi:hypothetical protein